MEIEKKNIIGFAAVLGVLGLGLKFAADDADREYGSFYREGFSIVPATMGDLDTAVDMMINIILGGRLRGGNHERMHITNNIRQSIQNGDCAFMIEDETGAKVGFVCGISNSLTEREMSWPGSRPTHLFANYANQRGFQGFGLGLLPEYRGAEMGLELMEWMKSRARNHGASYIWLGANADLNNRQMWGSRTDIVGDGPNAIFFASDVNRDLFAGR
jgi:hypothetical protein